MGIHQRDTRKHTYTDYLIWSRDYGDELINGVAYIREPPAPSRLHRKSSASCVAKSQSRSKAKSPEPMLPHSMS